MSATAAIFYEGDAYNTGGQVILGRQSAGEGFLKGLVRYSTAESLYCYTASQTGFNAFCNQVKPWMSRSRDLHWLSTSNPLALQQPGALFRPDSVISSLVWERRFFDQRAYSISGVIHSIGSKGATEDLGKLLLAPVQPWDALICTSPAGKAVVENLWQGWSEYLAQRTGGKITQEIQLPIIPLGVDCQAFPQAEAAQATRQRLRQQWGIAPSDIVVLYLGRLTFLNKAHPVPMFMAVERAKQLTGAKVHLLLVGLFDSEMESISFQQAAQAFCPSVVTSCVDGRSPEARYNVWCAADVFLSLADNIQETFGLTPIEAMAAGLPVVVSDWNGYQNSVRHEVDGFRIPTLTPPPAAGVNLAWEQLTDSLNYYAYAASTAMATAVDVAACTQALVTLFNHSELRQRMGESGRQRAKQIYDWQVVIAAYENLWQELAELRAKATLSTPLQPGTPPYPLVDDPFRLFAHYPTTNLHAAQKLQLGAMATPDALNLLRQIDITHFGHERRVSVMQLEVMLTAIAQAGSLTVADLISQYGQEQSAVLLQTLTYLLKFDVLRIAP